MRTFVDGAPPARIIKSQRQIGQEEPAGWGPRALRDQCLHRKQRTLTRGLYSIRCSCANASPRSHSAGRCFHCMTPDPWLRYSEISDATVETRSGTQLSRCSCLR